MSQVHTPTPTARETDEVRCTSSNSVQRSVVELEIVGSKCKIITSTPSSPSKNGKTLSTKDGSLKVNSQSGSRSSSNVLQKQSAESSRKTKSLRHVKEQNSKEKVPARRASESSVAKTALKQSSSNLKSSSSSVTAQKKTERSSSMPLIERLSGNLKQPQLSSASQTRPKITDDKLSPPSVRHSPKEKMSLSEPRLKSKPSRQNSSGYVSHKDSNGSLVSQSNSSSRVESAQKKAELTPKHSSTSAAGSENEKGSSKARVDAKKTRSSSSTKEQMLQTSGRARKTSPGGKAGEKNISSHTKEEKPEYDTQTVQVSGYDGKDKRLTHPEKQPCYVKEASQRLPDKPSRETSTTPCKQSVNESGRRSQSSTSSLNQFEVIESSNTLTFATPAYPEQRPRSNSNTSLNRMEVLNIHLEKDTTKDSSKNPVKPVSPAQVSGDLKDSVQTSIRASDEERKSRSPKSRFRRDVKIPVQKSDGNNLRSSKEQSRTDVEVHINKSEKARKFPTHKSRSKTNSEIPMKTCDEPEKSPSPRPRSSTKQAARKSTSAKGKSRSEEAPPKQTSGERTKIFFTKPTVKQCDEFGCSLQPNLPEKTEISVTRAKAFYRKQ